MTNWCPCRTVSFAVRPHEVARFRRRQPGVLRSRALRELDHGASANDAEMAADGRTVEGCASSPVRLTCVACRPSGHSRASSHHRSRSERPWSCSNLGRRRPSGLVPPMRIPHRRGPWLGVFLARQTRRIRRPMRYGRGLHHGNQRRCPHRRCMLIAYVACDRTHCTAGQRLRSKCRDDHDHSGQATLPW